MQFTKIFVSIAALASAALADIDWTSPATLACAKQHWAEIKAKADPLIPSAPLLLTPEQLASLSSLLSGQSTLPSNPTDAWLHQLPGAIPPSLLDVIAGDIINACLATST
ncbi:hypothetical protein DL89DRAFT_267114 [Linderina pennispora]|uniref:Uncharacterized protein n=1 Tax=Linderina pennispora TaxID=61395 RepID=A0A1Y1W9G3_9FUNG|nr:uncharacterized protein DL89DRAFT_267114 [Linderina pennispora]KAJ1934308.1 hypothetical protein EC988_008851 [Linderina pennispora]ORX69886.1 hypothetical protein DL89DRAFT_267114 [Linderina pennispora]